MANKGLKGNYPIPERILIDLQSNIKKGYNGLNRRRIIGYIKSGHLTDREIAKLVYDYKYHKLGNENDLNVIEKLINWADKEVTGKAGHIERTKRSKMDIGMENQFKKPHHKWMDDIKPIQFKNLIDVPKPATKAIDQLKDRVAVSESRYDLIKKILKEGLNLIKKPKIKPPRYIANKDFIYKHKMLFKKGDIAEVIDNITIEEEMDIRLISGNNSGDVITLYGPEFNDFFTKI
jgi:hypothetical protein